MENTNVETLVAATATTTTAPKGKRGVRPAVQERKARILGALKEVLADGTPRGPSDIARLLNAAGYTSPDVWTDAYHMLKDGVHFGCTFIEGAKRARYFLPIAAAPAVQTESAPAIEELNAELAELVQGLEEPAPAVEETKPAKAKGRTKKAA